MLERLKALMELGRKEPVLQEIKNDGDWLLSGAEINYYFGADNSIVICVRLDIVFNISKPDLMHAFGATRATSVARVFRDVITDNGVRCTINFILRENPAEYWPTADTPLRSKSLCERDTRIFAGGPCCFFRQVHENPFQTWCVTLYTHQLAKVFRRLQ